MTFIAPTHTRDVRTIAFFARKAAKPQRRILVADEDGARLAFGADGRPPALAAVGNSLEHLARIALG